MNKLNFTILTFVTKVIVKIFIVSLQQPKEIIMSRTQVCEGEGAK